MGKLEQRKQAREKQGASSGTASSARAAKYDQAQASSQRF